MSVSMLLWRWILSGIVAFSLLMLTVNSQPPCTDIPPAIEISTLLTLFNETGGTQWVNPWPIETSDNPCSPWQGVQCGIINGTCKVVSINLFSNNLIGKLPGEIGNLAFLQEIDFVSNALSGEIPSGICNAKNLSVLALSNNVLTGSIPRCFANLSSLYNLDVGTNFLFGQLSSDLFFPNTDWTILNLYNNYFSGNLPATIANCTKLYSLQLFSNGFHGPLPEALSNLESLLYFQLFDNFFTGPLPSFSGKYDQLINFDIHANWLTRSISASLGNIKSLNTLFLSKNLLSGSIPEGFGTNCTQLSVLDLHSNYFEGQIPHSMQFLSNLQALYLQENTFTGPFPDAVASLPAVVNMVLNNNFFSGTIPSTFGNARRIHNLILSSNKLRGSIPTSLGKLKKLAVFAADMNALTGTFPVQLCYATNLQQLLLNSNNLVGTLPDCFGNFSLMIALSLYSNYFHGHIPVSLASINNFMEVYLHDNAFSGSIPAFSSYIYELYLFSNLLTGKLPSSLASSKVSVLLLQDNYLSISLSEIFANNSFPALYSLGISNNILQDNVSVDIPSQLNYFDMAGVKFDGSLPKQWLQAPSLLFLDVSNNYFSGNLPDQIWNTSIERLFLNDNLFHGNFPGPQYSIAAINCTMQYISVSGNFLTGTLPWELSMCGNLTSFVASEMYLSGSIQNVFHSGAILQNIIVANNFLTGPINDVFLSSAAQNLVLNGAYNRFTGTLPIDSLVKGTWQALILTENCLKGTIPALALCVNENLQELLLSGLHTSPSCRKDSVSLSLSFHVYSSYIESDAIAGTLPACLFDLPELTYLTLSSNNLRGSLPSDLFILSPYLQGVDLSHNNLVGNIPVALFEADFMLLDLSFNRFSGVIPANISDFYASNNNSKLSLQVNTLSGKLPVEYVHAYDINVLDGNMFSCDASWTTAVNLPVNDPLAETYSCGSSSTDLSLLTLLLIVTVTGIIMFVWMGIRHFYSREIDLGTVNKNEVSLMGVLKEMLHHFMQWSQTELQLARHLLREHLPLVIVLVGMFLLSMVTYAVSSVYSSVYAEMYIWVVSLSLQQGTIAGSLLFLWLCLFVMFFLAQRTWFLRSVRERFLPQEETIHSTSETESISSSAASPSLRSRIVQSMHWCVEIGSSASAWYTCWIFLLVIGIHTIPVFAANIAYVYTTTIEISTQHRVGIVLSMALFKLVWNSVFNFVFLQKQLLIDAPMVSMYVSQRRWFDLFASLGVFNLIIAPIVTEILISPNCFKYVFARIPTNSYQVQGGTCYWATYNQMNFEPNDPLYLTIFPCASLATLQEEYNSGSLSDGGNYNLNIISSFSNGQSSTIDFQSGFAYNFQCSFSMLQAFVHVFVYRYILSIFLLPLLWYWLKQLQGYTYHHCGPSHWSFQWTSRCLPLMYRVLNLQEQQPLSMRTMSLQSHQAIDTWVLVNGPFLQQLSDSTRAMTSAETLLSRLMADVAVSLSFGILFPPLGILALTGAAADLWTTKWMLTNLRQGFRSFGRALHRLQGDSGVQEHEHFSEKLLTIIQDHETAYEAILPRIVKKSWLILQFAVVLWAFALYDVLGRTVGAIVALWVLVLVMTMPLWSQYLLLPLLLGVCERWSSPLWNTWWKRQVGAAVHEEGEMDSDREMGPATGDVEMIAAAKELSDVQNPLQAAINTGFSA